MHKRKKRFPGFVPKYHRTDGLWGILPTTVRQTGWHRSTDSIANMSLRERNFFNNFFEPVYGRAALNEFLAAKDKIMGLPFDAAVKLILENAWHRSNPVFRASIFEHFNGREPELVGLVAKFGGPDKFYEFLREKARLNNTRKGITNPVGAALESMKKLPAPKKINLDSFKGFK